MSELARPKRVVILDADNPLREIQGEFFWAEDHARILATERESAYRAGYDAGYEAAARHHPQRMIVKVRRGGLRRVLVFLVLVALTATFLAELISQR
jgi:hypothetical protein